MHLLLNILVLTVWSPKGKKNELKGKGGCQSLKFSEVTSARGDEGCNSVSCAKTAAHPCVSTYMIRSNSDQIADPWYLEGRVLSAHPVSHQLHTSCSGTHTQLPGKGFGWGISTWCWELTLTDLNMTIYSPSFPWKFPAFIRFQSSKLHQTDPANVGSQIPGASYFSPL